MYVYCFVFCVSLMHLWLDLWFCTLACLSIASFSPLSHFSFASAPCNQSFVLVPSNVVMFPFLFQVSDFWFSRIFALLSGVEWWAIGMARRCFLVAVPKRAKLVVLLNTNRLAPMMRAMNSTPDFVQEKGRLLSLDINKGALGKWYQAGDHTGSPWQNLRVFKSDPELVNLAV